MEEFVELFCNYNGTITQKANEPGRLEFSSVNDLVDYWGKHHKVLCKITVNKSFIVDPKRYSVWADEKTCEIIGGSARGSLTKDEALERVQKELVRYNFQQRRNMQTSLF